MGDETLNVRHLIHPSTVIKVVRENGDPLELSFEDLVPFLEDSSCTHCYGVEIVDAVGSRNAGTLHITIQALALECVFENGAEYEELLFAIHGHAEDDIITALQLVAMYRGEVELTI